MTLVEPVRMDAEDGLLKLVHCEKIIWCGLIPIAVRGSRSDVRDAAVMVWDGVMFLIDVVGWFPARFRWSWIFPFLIPVDGCWNVTNEIKSVAQADPPPLTWCQVHYFPESKVCDTDWLSSSNGMVVYDADGKGKVWRPVICCLVWWRCSDVMGGLQS